MIIASLVLLGLISVGFGYLYVLTTKEFKALANRNDLIIEATSKVVQRLDELSDQGEELQGMIIDAKLKSQPQHFVTRM
jgi:hypothetical protein